MFWLRGQLLSPRWLVQSSCLATWPGRGVWIHTPFSSQDTAIKTSKASVCRYVYISWSRFCPRGPAVLPDTQPGFVSTPGLVWPGNPRRHTRVDAAAWSGPPPPRPALHNHDWRAWTRPREGALLTGAGPALDSSPGSSGRSRLGERPAQEGLGRETRKQPGSDGWGVSEHTTDGRGDAWGGGTGP